MSERRKRTFRKISTCFAASGASLLLAGAVDAEPPSAPLPPTRSSAGPLPPSRPASGPLPPSRSSDATAPATTRSGDPAAVARLRAAFGPNVEVIDTAHFRIAFTAGRVFVDHRAELFERTHDSFLRFFRSRGFALTEPAKRMEVVLFATRRELDAFARGHAPLLEGADGMYLTRENRALFFNAHADTAYLRLSSEVSTYERDVARFRRDVTAVDGDRVIVDYGNGRTREVGRSELLAEIADEERKLRAAKEKLRQHVNGTNVSTTIHECAHQLSFNMGLLDARADTPHWLSEGIATLFESSLRGEVRDPSGVNPERAATFRTARRTDRMIPLAELLTNDGYFFSNTSPQAYAQSWALTSFLVQRHPPALREYMAVVRSRRAEPDAKIDEQQRLADFRAAFGEDLAAFERGLFAYVDGLR